MEGGPFSKLGSRPGAAHIRLKMMQQLQGWRAVPFQNWALALAPRTFVLKMSNSFKDGGRFVFKTGLSPETSLQFMFPELDICNSFTDGGQFAFKMQLSP